MDADKVHRKRDPGRCYKHAGFTRVGQTKGGLIAWHMAPEQIPAAQAPLGVSLSLAI